MPPYHLSHISPAEFAPIAVVTVWMIISLASGKMFVFSRTKGPLLHDRKRDWPEFWLGIYFGIVIVLVGSIVTIATHISKDPQTLRHAASQVGRISGARY